MYAAAAAASNPYALQGTGLISLAQNPMAGAAAPATASTGNPLLDAYGQYAALAAATGVYTTSASATGTEEERTVDSSRKAVSRVKTSYSMSFCIEQSPVHVAGGEGHVPRLSSSARARPWHARVKDP